MDVCVVPARPVACEAAVLVPVNFMLTGSEVAYVLGHSRAVALLVQDALAEATEVSGSWWEAWSDWIRPRAGDARPATSAPATVLEPAPGTYVHDRAPP